MRKSVQRILCGMSLCLTLIGASAMAHAEMPEWASKGQFLVSGGLNIADVQKTTWGGDTETTGSESGITLEGAYNYPLGKSWSVEGGLMHWSIADVSGTGLSASAFYQMKSGMMLGAGIIPSGGRFIVRQPFGRSGDEGKSSGLFGQLTLNGFSGDSAEYDSVMWTSLSIGYAF